MSDRGEIARATAEEAAGLVEADTAALVVRSVEGARVLWQEPGGPDPVDTWGPATLAALLGAGQPVREVLKGDPLAAGAKTSLLTVPVPVGGMLAGSILARRLTDREFTPAEEDALSRLARMTGTALDVAGRRGRPKIDTSVDPVTGFWSREKLLTDLRSSLRAAQLHGMPVSLVLLEVVGLASLRLEHGPCRGDEALADIAALLGRRMRVGDLAYRFGHDEIAVLLPLTGGEAAAAATARLSALPLDLGADLGAEVAGCAAVGDVPGKGAVANVLSASGATGNKPRTGAKGKGTAAAAGAVASEGAAAAGAAVAGAAVAGATAEPGEHSTGRRPTKGSHRSAGAPASGGDRRADAASDGPGEPADLEESAAAHARRLADLVGVVGLRGAWVPVEGQAEDVVLSAVRALAAAGRARR